MDDKEIRRVKYEVNPDPQIEWSKKYYHKHRQRILSQRKLRRKFNSTMLLNIEKLLSPDSQ